MKFVLFTALFFLSTGCGTLWTQKSQYAGVDRMLAGGDYAAAAAQIERFKITHYLGKDQILYELDSGMLQHWTGEFRESNDSLETAEQSMETAFTKSISRAMASFLLNDNILEYSGEDYEDIYVNVFKALNYIELDQPDNAFVEVRRIDEKLKQLEDRYWKMAQEYEEASQLNEPFKPGKSRFQNSALGRWLSLLLYRKEGRLDSARIDLELIQKAQAMQPEIYPFSLPDLSDMLTPPQNGHVKVPFLLFTGLAPEKRADSFWIHTEKDQIIIASTTEQRYGGNRLSGMNVFFWPGMEPGFTFKFQLPTMKRHPSEVSSIRIRIDGQAGPVPQRIESLENAAIETFAVKQPLIYLKTISRTVTKGIAAAQARRAAEEKYGELEGFLISLLSGTAISVTENADLRSSRFFPAEAYVTETELPPGTHEIEVDYIGRSGAVLYTDRLGAVEIQEHSLNLIESAYLN